MNIKKIILGAIITISIGNVYAQSDDDTRLNLEFGVKAGINYSNVWDSRGEAFRADPKLGLAGGFFMGIPLGKIFGLQPEILLSQKGFEGSGTLLGLPYSFSKTTTYLDIPLQLQIKPIQNFTLLAGPQFSYLLHQKDKYTLADNSTLQEKEFENDNIRKNILGFLAGADFYYEHFIVSGRFGWDFQTNHGDGTTTTPRYKNRWMQLTVGYKF